MAPDGLHPSSILGAVRDYARRRRSASGPLRILIVDDEEPVRKFVDRVLSGAGHQTTIAGSGPEAIELAGKMDGLDLMVTDLMMPEMTGDELARRLRQSEPALKVLYLTGFSDQLFKEKVTLWEDEAFLDKPCSVEGLRQAVSLLAYGHVGAAPGSLAQP